MSATVRVVCPRCNGTAVDPYMRDANHFAIADDPKCACLAGVGGCAGRGYQTFELHPSDPLAAPLVDSARLDWIIRQIENEKWRDLPATLSALRPDEHDKYVSESGDFRALIDAAMQPAPTERKPSDG